MKTLTAGLVAMLIVLSITVPASADPYQDLNVVERTEEIGASLTRKRVYQATIEPRGIDSAEVALFQLITDGTDVIAPTARVHNLVTGEKITVPATRTATGVDIGGFTVTDKVKITVYGLALGEGSIHADRSVPSISDFAPTTWTGDPLGTIVTAGSVDMPDNLHAIAIGGQSNVQGGFGDFTRDPVIDAATQAGMLWQVVVVNDEPYELGIVQVPDAYATLDFNNSASAPTSEAIGYGGVLGARYAVETGQPVLLLPVGAKGTSITRWVDGANKGVRFRNYLEFATDIPGTEFIATIWQHGEADIKKIATGSDPDDVATIGDYTSLLTGFRGEINDWLGHEAVFIYGETAPGWDKYEAIQLDFHYALELLNESNWGHTKTDGLLTNAEQHERDQNLPDGEDTDFIHYSADSQVQLGERHAAALFTLLGID